MYIQIFDIPLPLYALYILSFIVINVTMNEFNDKTFKISLYFVFTNFLWAAAAISLWIC